MGFPGTRNRIIMNSVVAQPAVLTVKTLSGESISVEKLQLKVAKEATASHVVHRYLTMYLRNKRQGSANTKTRSEVRGGGKKPYTQKKTGRARRGTNRSPLRPGGGVLFGPKPRSWSIKINKKERRLAMATALQNSSEIMTIVNDFELLNSKTKTILQILLNLGADPMKEKVVLITKELNLEVIRASKNVRMLTLLTSSSINVFDILTANKIIIDKNAFTYINDLYRPSQIPSNLLHT